MRTAVAVFVMAASSAQAANLKELLEAADQQNVDRRLSAESRDKAVADYRAAWTALLPSLTAQGVWTNNQYAAGPFTNPFNPTGPQLTLVAKDQLDATFRFDLPLIDTGRWFRAMAGAAGTEAAAERESATRQLVQRQVVAAWYGYAAALAVRESAKRSTKVADAQAELQEIRSKAGAATELEMLRAKAEAQRNRQVVADTESLVATTRRTLRTLSGADPDEQAALPSDDMTREAGFEELEKNVDALPQVRAADRDADVAGKLATAQRLAVLPTIGAQFTERVSNAAGFTGQASSYTLGLAIAWRLDGPLFMNMSGATATQNISQLGAERARLVARDQIHSDWQRLNAALQKIEAAKAQMQAAERAAQVARDRYAAGAATQIDVIQAERDLFSSEVGQIQARTELASARLSLKISAGLPLDVQ